MRSENLNNFYTPSPKLELAQWQGLERERQKRWQTTSLLTRPFYNIEYFVAWIAAFIYMESYRQNPKAAVTRLEEAMSYGNTKSMTETLTTLGVNFPFTQHDIRKAKEGFGVELLMDH